MWSEQDGAKAHNSQNSLNVLRLMFAEHVRGDVGPPVRSPDLSIVRLIFVKLYQRKNLEEVMNISNAVIQHFGRRLQQNVDNNGLNLVGIIFQI